MSGARKNVLVGVTVLGALLALGWMIVQFGGTLGGLAGGAGYRVNMSVPRVDGLSPGGRVQYLGLGVGRIEAITLDESRSGFDVTLMIRDGTDVPANVKGVVRSTNLISGGAAIELEYIGDAPEGFLVNGPDRIEGVVGGSELIPPEFASLADELQGLVAELREADVVGNFNAQAERIGELATSLNEIAGDESLQADVRLAVANTRDAAAAAADTAREFEQLGKRLNALEADAQAVMTDAKAVSSEAREAVASARETFDDAATDLRTLQGKLIDRADEAGRIFASVDSVLAKIDNGEGTLGQLVNDPRAYEALNDDLLLLGEILKDARRLVRQIEEEGFKFSVF
jgi:phospholipid/cholesterol/gamma-HCH transport system substrate-binding protein